MGAEAKTTLKVGRQTFAGTAHLETSELRFRGETSLRIPFANVREVVAKNGETSARYWAGLMILIQGTPSPSTPVRIWRASG